MPESANGHETDGVQLSLSFPPLRSTTPAGGINKPTAVAMAAWTMTVFCLLSLGQSAFALESGTYRLLSVATSGKLILISQPATKTRYILDASNAKITANGKPLEFQELTNYVSIHVKFDLRKSTKAGIEIDGTASDITVPVTLPGDKPNRK
jgi:hypothetical protein